jgi:hypothetical protein
MNQGVEMGTTESRLLGAGLFFIFILLSGFWLSRSGKPFNVIILTIHKLISLAAVVFLIRTIHQANQAVNLGAVQWIAVVVTGLLFAGTMATGGILSTGKPTPAFVQALHRITPYLTVLSAAAMLYLSLNRT